MILEDISGIVDFDGSAAVKVEETGCKIMTITLRTVLLKYLRLSNGHQLIVEIHQSKEPMAPVIDRELGDYMQHAEKKCQQIKLVRIPFLPEASLWIKQTQLY